jgi:Matrixin
MVLLGTQAAPPPPPEARRRRGWVAGGVAAVVLLILLGRAVLGSFSGGSYEFLSTQGDVPVTWNHCQAIPFQVNPKGAPPDWQDIVRAAIDDVQDASGFVFADRGTTVKTQLIGNRYPGNEWEPVLIVWSDRYQDEGLDGRVVGLGGGRSLEVNGVRRYVIGQVSLDSTEKDPFVTRMVLEHELGHVLGLGHTSDPQQLMYEGYHGQTGLGKGDIAGLKALHDVPCD